MSRVRIPPTLRAAAGGQKLVELSGATVAELLDALIATYPDVRDVLLGPDGEPNRFINLYLGEVDIRHLDGLATPVPDGATLTLLPAMAGGAGSTHDDDPGRCSCPRRVRRD